MLSIDVAHDIKAKESAWQKPQLEKVTIAADKI